MAGSFCCSRHDSTAKNKVWQIYQDKCDAVTARQLARRHGFEGGAGIVDLEAHRLWNAIPKEQQAFLLDNVFCPKCRQVTTIIEYSGSVERGDLVLDGRCQRCGSEVARVIEFASR